MRIGKLKSPVTSPSEAVMIASLAFRRAASVRFRSLAAIEDLVASARVDGRRATSRESLGSAHDNVGFEPHLEVVRPSSVVDNLKRSRSSQGANQSGAAWAAAGQTSPKRSLGPVPGCIGPFEGLRRVDWRNDVTARMALASPGLEET